MKEWPDNWPHFLRIEHLYVVPGKSIAVCRELTTVVHNWKVNAYEVTERDEMSLLILEELINKFPLAPYTLGSHTYIVNRHAHFGTGVP